MGEHNPFGDMHATTIITVRKGSQVVMAGDGQVSLGQTVMKGNARKVRRIGKDNNVIAGFDETRDGMTPQAMIAAIGSGGNYAYAAARALMDSDKSAEEIARRSMEIAGDICVYTNSNIVIETLELE